MVTPEPTLAIPGPSSYTSGLLGSQNGDTHVLPPVTGHTVQVRSEDTAPGSYLCQEEQNRQSSRSITSQVPAQTPNESLSRVLHKVGGNMTYMLIIYELCTVSHKPKSRTK